MNGKFVNVSSATSPALINGLGKVRQSHWLVVSVGLAILCAVLLPLNLFSTQPLHHDEALYATWGLEILSGDDPWLSETAIDKPPLYLYTVAGTMRLLGVSGSVARIPSLAATAVMVLLTFWLGQQIYNTGVGVIAAWLVALSPYTVLFAPTAFTDPMLVALVLGACLAAAYNRPVLAGLGLGLAIATKQQGLVFVPLVLALLAMSALTEVRSGHSTAASSLAAPGSVSRAYFKFGIALLLPLCLVLIWDLSRNKPSAFFEQSLTNYGGLSTDVANFSKRWLGFVQLLAYGTASPVLNFIFLMGLGLLLAYGLWLVAYRKRQSSEPVEATWAGGQTPSPDLSDQHSCPQVRLVLVDSILVLFSLGFLFLHALLSFQVWDRYLLGLVPILALLLARVLLLPFSIVTCHWLPEPHLARSITDLIATVAILLLLGLTLPISIKDAVNGRYPLGSNSHGLQGVDQITAYLQGHVGADTTLYHRWLGTHWRFYLWDYPYDLQYWAAPGDLVAKAKPGHLIAYPAWKSDTETRLALSRAGLTMRQLTQAYTSGGAPSITLYRIESKP